MVFGEINEKGFEMLSKIMFRSAKNLGLFNQLSESFKRKGFNSLKDYFLKIKPFDDIISNGVGTYWQLIFDVTRSSVLASFFMLSVITDERIFFIEKCAGNNDLRTMHYAIEARANREVDFILKRIDYDWQIVPKNRIEYFTGLIKSKKEFFNKWEYDELIKLLESKL